MNRALPVSQVMNYLVEIRSKMSCQNTGSVHSMKHASFNHSKNMTDIIEASAAASIAEELYKEVQVSTKTYMRVKKVGNERHNVTFIDSNVVKDLVVKLLLKYTARAKSLSFTIEGLQHQAELNNLTKFLNSTMQGTYSFEDMIK